MELTPQGTLAERLRAGGSGIPAFYTASGVGTQVADGGLPWRYDACGNVLISSPAKETRTFRTAEGEKPFVMEQAIVCDFGLYGPGKVIGTATDDRLSARNFNPMAAMSGKITIAEVEQLVEPHRVLPLTPERSLTAIERARERTREQMAARAA